MRVLVDTSIWIDHLNKTDEAFSTLLASKPVVVHPYIVGEILLGSLKQREVVRRTLEGFKSVTVAEDSEVLGFIEHNQLFGAGIGYIDAHLLAAAKLSDGVRLWTRDRRLADIATRLDVNHAAAQ
jgi:predicted nucleic acid-binding protein